MVQNATLMASLSKGGEGGNGEGGGGRRSKGGGSNNGSWHKTPRKEKKLSPNCNKVVIHDPATCFSLEAKKDKCPTGRGTERGE